MEQEKEYPVRLYEHLDDREWNADQMNRIARLISSTDLIGEQVVLEILTIQQEVDDEITAQKEVDRWAIAGEFITRLPLTFFEDAEQHRTFIQHRFEDIQ